MCSDLIGLQGLLLGQAQTGKHVPKSKPPSIPESSGYWEHKMRLGMLVLSTVPWDAEENLADLPATLNTCQGLSWEPTYKTNTVLSHNHLQPREAKELPFCQPRDTVTFRGLFPYLCLAQPLNTIQVWSCVPAWTGSTSWCVFPNPVYKPTLKN